MKCKNTLQKGSVRYIVFKEGDTWYGVALEFNIVESGDDPKAVLFMLFEAISGYIESARRIKARPHFLNQRADQEYEYLWDGLQGKNSRKEKCFPPIFSFGETALAAV